VEVDYRGYEVTVENFVRLLTGRLPEDTPRCLKVLEPVKASRTQIFFQIQKTFDRCRFEHTHLHDWARW